MMWISQQDLPARELTSVGRYLFGNRGETSTSRRFVFISHSSRDTWIARQIAREVEECGATPFLDEADVNVGAEFEEEILESLDKAHELIVLLTPWALERPYIWAEL